MKIEIEIPMEKVLKEKEKDEFSKSFINSFKEKHVDPVELTDTHYLEKRSALEPAYNLVFLYLSGVADIVAIALAIWTVLKERKNTKYVTVKIGDEVLVKVKGNMSDKEVVKLVKEAKKGIEKRKK